MKTRILAALAALVMTSQSASATGNLVVNGGFDDPENPLQGWITDYRFMENRLYADNHTRVSVIEVDGPKRKVLRLYGTRAILWGSGQGVKVDSAPIPFEIGATYRLTASARSQADSQEPGPNCRIYIEGYLWKPGVKPHDNPELGELRRVYKQGSGNILYFGTSKSGAFSNVTPSWQKGSCTFPDDDLSDLARKHLAKVKFIVVHIVAIDGWDGALLVDDVELLKIK